MTLASGSVQYRSAGGSSTAGHHRLRLPPLWPRAVVMSLPTMPRRANSLAFYTVPEPAKGFGNAAQHGCETVGEWWRFGGGGTAWNGHDLRPRYTHGLHWSATAVLGITRAQRRNSDDLFLCSMIALDAKPASTSGTIIQSGRNLGLHAVMTCRLRPLVIKGKSRKVIMEAPKNGYFYVLDRLTANCLAEPYVKSRGRRRLTRTGRPVEVRAPVSRTDTSSRCGESGGRTLAAMSFSPQTGLVYIRRSRWHRPIPMRIDPAPGQRRAGSSGDKPLSRLCSRPQGEPRRFCRHGTRFAEAVWKTASLAAWKRRNDGTEETGVQGQANGCQALDAASEPSSGRSTRTPRYGAAITYKPMARNM